MVDPERRDWSAARILPAPRNGNSWKRPGRRSRALLIDLGTFRQPSGKIVAAFASEGDFDPASLQSNVFAMEWPPRSGKTTEFPEVDRAAWFDLDTAATKILKGQRPILAALAERFSGKHGPGL